MFKYVISCSSLFSLRVKSVIYLSEMVFPKVGEKKNIMGQQGGIKTKQAFLIIFCKIIIILF